jgi:hypothetical protein
MFPRRLRDGAAGVGREVAKGHDAPPELAVGGEGAVVAGEVDAWPRHQRRETLLRAPRVRIVVASFHQADEPYRSDMT